MSKIKIIIARNNLYKKLNKISAPTLRRVGVV